MPHTPKGMTDEQIDDLMKEANVIIMKLADVLHGHHRGAGVTAMARALVILCLPELGGVGSADSCRWNPVELVQAAITDAQTVPANAPRH